MSDAAWFGANSYVIAQFGLAYKLKSELGGKHAGSAELGNVGSTYQNEEGSW
jgi:hypothetical protein